jgi:hypothetical protein
MATLAEVSVPKCYAAVVRALDDCEPSVRDYACQGLGKMGSSKARRHLRRRLEDPDEQVRYSAVAALWWPSRALALERLRAMLIDESELVRLVVVEAFVDLAYAKKSNSRLAEKIVTAHAENERGGLVRCELVAWSYSRTKSAGDLTRLVKLMESRRGIVRWRAYASIPERLPHPHVLRMLAVIRRSMERKRPGNMRDLLKRIEQRLTDRATAAR